MNKYRICSRALIHNQDNEWLIIKVPLGEDKWCYDIAGGKLEINESPRDCAIRETWEEVGLSLKPETLEYYGMCTFSFIHGGTCISYIFITTLPTKEKVRINNVLEGHEVLDYKWVKWDELQELCSHIFKEIN